MKKPYDAPSLTVYGSVAEITAADFTNQNQDNIYLGSNVVGNAQGSLDACVFGEGDPPPDANCIP
jgi:hypothetical protein